MCVRNILVPTNLSESSRKSVDYALCLAGDHGAEVTVLYVVDSRKLMGFGRELEEFTIRPSKELRQKYECTLKTFLESHAPTGDIHGLVEIGIPYKRVMNQVDKQRPDLIILAIDDNGKAGPLSSDRMAAVIANATCPVLIIGPGTFRDHHAHQDANIERTVAGSTRVV